ncbi:hypothetical protein RRG08_029298 [Elysia crispata]|uniref:Secreted protein n=1 Tax=Elysia crispata TaxID=231223 RepID=A0AAE1DTE0_9GAST|nr:hypothetical protein RRG08_029298 [Elysia crispata]
MLLVGTFIITVLGLVAGDQCKDQIEECRSTHWLPHERDPLPQQRCEALRALFQCLSDLDYDCAKDVQRETFTQQARTCYISTNSPCSTERKRCQTEHEADLDLDPVRACARATAWVSCLKQPDVVFLCGPELPQKVRDIWYDRCYLHPHTPEK